jgi:hypothetical protein
MGTDFFKSQYGNYVDLPFWRQRRTGRVVDTLFDARLAMNGAYRRLNGDVATAPRLNVFVMGVNVPARSRDLQNVLESMSSERHRVVSKMAVLHEGKGKYQNINLGLTGVDLDEFDWLIVTDDDVSLPANFLDRFLYLAEKTELKICQPAHRFHSYQSYAVTQRSWNSLVRVTHFVESGPVTAFRREMFPLVLPFPELRWAWGNDLWWVNKAERHGYRVGIVDGTPIGHLRPVAETYDHRAARREADAFLHQVGVEISRFDALQTEAVYTALD